MALPTEEDHRWVATTVWDHINNKEWDCGWKFEIHPESEGKYKVYQIMTLTSHSSHYEHFGEFSSIKEAKEAIGKWKLEEYKKWEFKQKNPVIYVG